MADIERDFKHNGERLLAMIQRHHPDYHPILAIARIANSDELERESPEAAVRAHATILKYIEPELKSVEVKLDKKERREINVTLFREVEDAEEYGPKKDAVEGPGDRALLEDLVGQIVDAEVVG